MEQIRPVIEESWGRVLLDEFNKPYFLALKSFLVEEKKRYRIFPPGPMIFNAFNHTPFDKVRVVFIGQDPYHGFGQAHGLCFSVPDGIAKPPSLENIFKELKEDLEVPIAKHGNLTRWADQGVLLLNATLTVRENQAGSHQNKGWETFTDTVIMKLSELRSNLVFVLWGNYAIAKRELIDNTRHYVFTAAHPSPLSAHKGFFGCRHFSAINETLVNSGSEPIDWRLE
jgi:uracil-DNA glycosylase